MPRITPVRIVEAIKDQYDDVTAKQLRGETVQWQLGIKNSGSIAYIAGLCKELNPNDWIPDEADFVVYKQCVAYLEDALAHWHSNDANHYLASIKINDRFIGVLSALRGVLERCPAEPVAAAIGELAFVTDPALRDDLGRDIEEARRALGNREWKSATVVAGSVVEGLLLWALDTKTPAERQAAWTRVAAAKTGWKSQPPAALDDWTLYQFVALAAELQLLDPETAKQADLARDFRNYIHPGKVRTQGKRCDEPMAFTAVAAVMSIVRDLKSRFPVPTP